MADLRQLPPDILHSVAVQIGDRIAEEFSSSAEAVPPAPINGVEQSLDFWPLAGLERQTAQFKLAETFEVWRLRDDAGDELASTDEDLVTLMRWTRAYRHLVRLIRGDKWTAVAFAQSYKNEQNGDDLTVSDLFSPLATVRDFFLSPLAAQMDEAIELADKLVPEAAVTRLISMPEFKVEALWFITLSATPAPGGDAVSQPPSVIRTRGVIVISAPPSFSGQTMSLMDSSTFIRALAGTTRGMGLLL